MPVIIGETDSNISNPPLEKKQVFDYPQTPAPIDAKIDPTKVAHGNLEGLTFTLTGVFELTSRTGMEELI